MHVLQQCHILYSIEFLTVTRDDLGVTVDARTYYNLVQNTRGNKEKDTTISRLLIALDDSNVYYSTVRG
jgi:hypothetical protein